MAPAAAMAPIVTARATGATVSERCSRVRRRVRRREVMGRCLGVESGPGQFQTIP